RVHCARPGAREHRDGDRRPRRTHTLHPESAAATARTTRRTHARRRFPILTIPRMNESPRVTRDMLHRLPKTDLHVHLDGSLRPETMLELADAAGIELPARDAAALGEYMHVREGRDLVDYLARFDITLALMQTEDA